MKKKEIQEEVRSFNRIGLYFLKNKNGEIKVHNFGFVIKGKYSHRSYVDFIYNKGKNRFELNFKEVMLINSKQFDEFKKLVEKAEKAVNRLNKLVSRHKHRFLECIQDEI